MKKIKEFFSSKSKRKIMYVSLFTFLLLGFTLAYVAPIISDITKTNILAEGAQVDELIFIAGDELIFTPSMSNLAEDGSNYTESTIAYAKITANTETNTYTATYNVAIEITENEYIYTVDESTPELILTITKPDGSEVTEIEGLTYYTNYYGINGFDVTTAEGLFTIALDYATTTTSTITDEWIITISMVNLESNQALNGMKTFNADVIMSENEFTGTVYLVETLTNLVGTQQGAGELVNENGYRYEGGDPNNYISFNNETWRIIGVFYTEVVNNDGDATIEPLVKIIKNESIDILDWDSDNINNWPTSSLYTYLNGDYYNSIDSTYIENVIWELGGVSDTPYTATNFYEAERGVNGYSVYEGRATTTEGFIGLMYMSDYGYAVLSDNCSRTLAVNDYNEDDIGCNTYNWLYTGDYFWTIVPYSSNGNYAWLVSWAGNADSYSSNFPLSTAPVLYLKSNVELVGGSGTSDDMYVIG